MSLLSDMTDLLVGTDNEQDIKNYGRLISLYGIAMVSNGVRCEIRIPKETKSIPINIYGIGFASSGIGKSKGMRTVTDWCKPAMSRIREKTQDRLDMVEPFEADELKDLTKEGVTVADTYKSLTDSSTLKLMRILDITTYGSVNYISDEFASVVMKDYEMLSSTILEVFDFGEVSVNLRATSKTAKCENKIPFNNMFFGSPHLLFESNINTEKAFTDLLTAGLARRCLFSNVTTSVNKFSLDALANGSTIKSIENRLFKIQDVFDHYVLTLSDEATEIYSKYETKCIEDSAELSEYDMLNKIYTRNKFWLCLKLSGLLSVSKDEKIVSSETYSEAVQIVEDSHKEFLQIVNRPEKYELIVDWLMEQDIAQNEYTLTQKLPFYKEIKQKKQFIELMKGYAYQNNITLQIEDKQNMTFYTAKAKKKTDLNEPLLFSYSEDMTSGYYPNDSIAWKDFHKVIQKKGIHYSAHNFKDMYRNNDNAIEGVQLIILDIDGNVSLELAKALFEEYEYLIATTKSHGIEKNGVVADRFRIVLPMKNTLELNSETYSKFMKNVFENLPIEVDELSDSARFFYSAEGEYWYNKGELFDGDAYVPNTQEQEIFEKKSKTLSKKNIDGIGQYIIRGESNGRNKQLIKLALLLNDKGYSHEEAKTEILRVNNQFGNPLTQREIEKTIFKTLTRKEEVEVEDDYSGYIPEDDSRFED